MNSFKILVSASIAALAAAAPPLIAQSTFTNLPIGGGGYVTGLVVHPQKTSVVYARTDVGGTYLYDSTDGSWTQLMGNVVPASGVSPEAYYSCDGMCVDPSDTAAQKVYAYVGDSGTAYLMYSSDQGSSWTDTKFPTDIDGYGNGDYRWGGDRTAIDPNDPGRILVGTRANGLWYNDVVNGTPSSSNWSQYTAVPVGVGKGESRGGSTAIGVTFVAFYKGSGSSGSPTPVIYAGVSGGTTGTDGGIYESTDAGGAWTEMSGSPTFPVQGRVDSSGTLYVTGGNSTAGSSYGGVWKYTSGSWTNITPSGAPSGAQFSALDVNPNDSSDLVCAVGDADTSPVYYSTSGSGTTSSSWSTKTGTANNTVPWQPSSFFDAHVSYALFAPTTANPNQVWSGDWYDVWATSDITASSPTWTDYEQGFEETYSLALRAGSPTGSGPALVFTGCEDVDGFRHPTIAAFPPTGFTGENDTTGIDVYEGNNNDVYRVGDSEQTSGYGFKSTDNGVTWSSMTLPASNAMGGKIAISAGSSNLLVWVPVIGSGTATTPYCSTDGGTAWSASTGAPSHNWANNTYYAAQILASNKTGSNCFYLYQPQWGFYVSNTGVSAGSSFSSSGTGLPSSTNVSGYTFFGVKSVPGQAGGVWVNIAGSGSSYGIYASTNYGANFSQVSGIVSATAIAFGAPPPGTSEPATVYCLGQESGDTRDWIYESDNMGSSWFKLNTVENFLGDKPVNLEADRNVYEAVYVGTFGTGEWANAMFLDSFADGGAANWTTDSGTWSVVSNGTSNVYEVSSTDGGISQAGESNWGDYSVEADVTPVTLGGGHTMQLAMRFQDSGDNYMALLYPKAVDIVKNVGGVQTTLATTSYTVNTGTTYDVELAAVGDNLTLYVNQTQVLTATDGSFTDGQIAVGAYDATGQFDNVVVRPQ